MVRIGNKRTVRLKRKAAGVDFACFDGIGSVE
jgi:hypothetical protein